MADKIQEIMDMPEFDLQSFSVIDLESQVLRKYYIELSSVLFIEDIARYFLSELIINTDEFEVITKPFSHKDKGNAMLNIIHRKIKSGDKNIFKMTLDSLFFYGIDKVQAVSEKMRRKLFEMRINRRSEIKQRMNSRIQGREEPNYFYNDDDPVEVPEFPGYRTILRCNVKLKTTMTRILRKADFPVIREACYKNARTEHGPWLSKYFIESMKLVETVEELLDVLLHNHQWDWINFEILESIVDGSNLDIARKVLDAYKDYMLQLTLLSVFSINSMVTPIDNPGVEYTKVKEVLAADVKHMTVGQLLEHKTYLEQHIFDINKGSTRVAFIDSSSWEVVWIIPAECSYHAYKRACSNVSKFSSVVSLQIEDYPAVKQIVEHSIDPPNVTLASSAEIVDQHSSVLLEQMNATSITDMLVTRGLLTETDRQVIDTAANEYQKNYYILERVHNMDNDKLILFCDVLQRTGHQQHIGGTLMNKLSAKRGHLQRAVTLPDTLQSSDDKEAVTTPRRNSLGKRLPTRGASPTMKRTKVIEASRRFSSLVTEICKALESTKPKHLANFLNQLLASKEQKIPVFPSEIIDILADCENAGILVRRMSLYFSWFDHEILKKLIGASNCKKATRLLREFDSQLDYSLPLSSQLLPVPSPNMVPIDTHPSTLLAITMTTHDQSQYSLRYIDELRSMFSSLCKISQYALYLVAVKQAHATSLVFYWMLPKAIVPLICCKVQENCKLMRARGVLEVAVYPGVVIATDSEVRLGSLAFLTIKDGSCHADAKLSLTRVNEVPDTVTKLFSELDEYRKQEEKKSEVELQMQTEAQKTDQHKMDIDTQERDEGTNDKDDQSGKGEEDIYLIDLWLSKNLPYYCHQLEQHVPSICCLNQITATSWESREACLKQLTRNLALLLVPSFTDDVERRPSNWKLSRYENIKAILEACCAIVAYSCTDPVFAVYQASLNLCWVLAFVTLCSSATELDELQNLFKPIFSAVFSRYHDPQEHIRDCTKQFLRVFIHTQVGILSTINNLPTTFRLGGVECILMAILAPPVNRHTSEQWWLGRLHFLQDAFTTKYGHYFFPRDKPQELHYYNSYRRSLKSTELPIPVSREESLTLFTLLWKFVSDATRSQYDAVVDMAVQIYCDSVDLVLDYSDGLVRAKEFINACRQSVVGRIKKLILKAQDRVVQLEKEAIEAAAAAVAAAEKARKEKEEKENNSRRRRRDSDDESGKETKEEKAKEEKPIEETQDDQQPSTPEEPEPSDTTRVGTLFKQVAQYVPVEILKHEELLGQLLVDSDISEAFPSDLWGGKELGQDKVDLLASLQAEHQSKRSCPPIFLPAPTGDMLIHVQVSDEDKDAVVYREGMEWIRGSLVCADNIYSAQDVRTGTIVAVKQVSYSADNKEEKEEVLLKELILVMGLDHSNIVRCIGATHEPMAFNMFLEWSAGGSLKQLLSNCKGLHPLVVASYTRQVIQGMAYLHSLGILHRNLCDATLLVDCAGQRVKVSDLSCAVKMNDSEVTERVQFSDGYKIHHALYTAPEMLRTEPYGLSSDVWSIGCCIIKMATGQPPWNLSKANDPYAEAINIAMATSAPIIPGNLTAEVTDLVIRCLQLRPEDRLRLSEVLDHAMFKHDTMP